MSQMLHFTRKLISGKTKTRKAMKKQPNSQMCFVCGLENPIGLKMAFYQDDEGRVVARFTPGQEHQGYPGTVHGGIVTALLDETLGRVAIAQERWMATGRLNIRFRQPIPLGESLTVIGQVVSWKKQLLEARGEIRLADDSVGAEASGTFVEIPPERIDNMEEALVFWQVVPDADDEAI
jgi:uncharacterized protein (TIGR00369 family)